MRAAKDNVIPKQKTNWTIAILVTALLTIGNFFLSKTPFGVWMEFNAYELLHYTLVDLDKALPVLRIDISEIPNYPHKPTSREMLKHVLSDLLNRHPEERPAAIGIDIDFSPEISDADSKSVDYQDFPNYCDDIWHLIYRDKKGNKIDAGSKIIPVFLGIKRTAANDPKDWLAFSKFAYMAANIGYDPNRSHYISRWTKRVNADPSSTMPTFLPSLGEALAQAYVANQHTPLPGPDKSAFLIETIYADPIKKLGVIGGEERHDLESTVGVTEGVSLVNFSKLDQLKQQFLKVEIRDGVATVTGDFANKIVIIGDTNVEDTFTVPGRDENAKGIYLHACATYTFVREPLYKLKSVWRSIIDLLISVIIFILLSLIERIEFDIEHTKKYQQIVTVSTLLSVIVAGLALVRFAGIMWFDFIAIVISMCVHPVIAYRFEFHLKMHREKHQKQRESKTAKSKQSVSKVSKSKKVETEKK